MMPGESASGGSNPEDRRKGFGAMRKHKYPFVAWWELDRMSHSELCLMSRLCYEYGKENPLEDLTQKERTEAIFRYLDSLWMKSKKELREALKDRIYEVYRGERGLEMVDDWYGLTGYDPY